MTGMVSVTSQKWIIVKICFPFPCCHLRDREMCHQDKHHRDNSSGWERVPHIPVTQSPSPAFVWGFIPDTVSEICAARHALPSSGLLGARPPSRPADHTPLASGSAVWPSVCRRGSRTCDTRRSYSEQSSANRPRGSPAGPLCPSDFRQLGNRWSCHLLLRQNSVSGRPDMSTALFSLSCQVLLPTKTFSWAGHQRKE